MDNAAFEAEINEHIQRLQDLNKQMGDIAQKIGALQEQGRALHNAALEVKGAIDALAKMKAKQDEKAAKKDKALVLPDKSLVAADGKTVIADANATPVAENSEAIADSCGESPGSCGRNARRAGHA